MKKSILFVFVCLVVAGLSFKADARVFKFSDLNSTSFHMSEFNADGDSIIFHHEPGAAFPLNYKQREDGIEFKLDNGEGATPRYNILGKLPIKPCGGQTPNMVKMKHVRGTIVHFTCNK